MVDRLTPDSGHNLVNVVVVVGLAIISNAELSVRGVSSAVTVRQIINDNLQELLVSARLAECTGRSQILLEVRNLRDGVYCEIEISLGRLI